MDPWSRVRAGNPNDPRTARHLDAMSRSNRASRGSMEAAAGLIDNCGPPYWDRQSWDQFKSATGREPFSASELPTSFDNCPVWAYERMGLRPPLMAQ